MPTWSKSVMDIAVSVRNVSKKYPLYAKPADRVKEALNPFGKKFHRDFWALSEVSLEVKKGEAVGLIGRNGSGKSTLLQVVCGILRPTSGEVTTYGRISAILELGTGFNPEYTGLRNVYMNWALMGFSKREIDEKIQSIEEFAEIGDFIRQPVKTYSSGMFVRLAFASAVHVKPEILVIDEALSVGDVFFQQKSFKKLRELSSHGTTCLFVSHDTAAIMNVCDRAVLLSEGQIEFRGKPEEVVSRYYSSAGKRFSGTSSQDEQPEERPTRTADLMGPEEILEKNILQSSSNRHGAGGLQIIGARVTDQLGRDTLKVGMLEKLSIHLLLKAREDVDDPSTGFSLFDRFGNRVFAAGTRQLRHPLPHLKAEQELVVRMEIAFTVQAGEYTFSLAASEPSEEGPSVGYLQDKHEMLGPIMVIANENQIPLFYGTAQLPMTLEHSSVALKESS